MALSPNAATPAVASLASPGPQFCPFAEREVVGLHDFQGGLLQPKHSGLLCPSSLICYPSGIDPRCIFLNACASGCPQIIPWWLCSQHMPLEGRWERRDGTRLGAAPELAGRRGWRVWAAVGQSVRACLLARAAGPSSRPPSSSLWVGDQPNREACIHSSTTSPVISMFLS